MGEDFCPTCGGVHEPDTDEVYVDFRGYRFHKPFLCMCCGKEICARQFAFGRCCGLCDMGACQLGSRVYRPSAFHKPPEWRRNLRGDESFKKFVEITKATPVPVASS